jgi:hypothetical protein
VNGQPSVWRRTGALEARAPRRAVPRTSWNLDALTVEELAVLMPLSEKQAAADEAGSEPAWTADELALVAALAAKAGADR